MLFTFFFLFLIFGKADIGDGYDLIQRLSQFQSCSPTPHVMIGYESREFNLYESDYCFSLVMGVSCHANITAKALTLVTVTLALDCELELFGPIFCVIIGASNNYLRIHVQNEVVPFVCGTLGSNPSIHYVDSSYRILPKTIRTFAHALINYKYTADFLVTKYDSFLPDYLCGYKLGSTTNSTIQQYIAKFLSYEIVSFQMELKFRLPLYAYIIGGILVAIIFGFLVSCCGCYCCCYCCKRNNQKRTLLSSESLSSSIPPVYLYPSQVYPPQEYTPQEFPPQQNSSINSYLNENDKNLNENDKNLNENDKI